MKILISSYFFSPGIGGVERFSFLMARTFAEKGHEVIVVTDTPDLENQVRENSFKILRRPGFFKLLKLLCWCDIFWQNSISLRYLLPNLLVRKPCFISFTTPMSQNWLIRAIKHYFLQRNHVISVSQGFGKLLGGISYAVIHNAFQSDSFFWIVPTEKRTRQLIYVGRLNPEKGVDILLQAIAILKNRGLEALLTVVGSGSEENKLRAMASSLKIEAQIDFVGSKIGIDLNNLINQHQVMVVPSNYPEAFGIVALEGIACGCPVIAADSFGLPEAVGGVGILFEMGNPEDCANKIAELLGNTRLQKRLLQNRAAHLDAHSPDIIADRYLGLFRGYL